MDFKSKSKLLYFVKIPKCRKVTKSDFQIDFFMSRTIWILKLFWSKSNCASLFWKLDNPYCHSKHKNKAFFAELQFYLLDWTMILEKVILYLNPISKFDLLCASCATGCIPASSDVLFPKLFQPTVRKNCSSNGERRLRIWIFFWDHWNNSFQ